MLLAMQVVTAAVLERDGLILLARRKTGRSAGKWEFPGGKLEPGETPEACLRRELAEEFGIVAEVGALVGEAAIDAGPSGPRLRAYRVRWLAGDLVPQDHDQVAWAAPAALLAYDLLPADVVIARQLGAAAAR